MDDSTFVEHQPCEECGSKDNKAVYSDGHSHCFGCGAYEHGDGSKELRANEALEQGEYRNLVKRNLRADTLRKFDYRLAGTAHFATYYNAAGKAVAQKKRTIGKEFSWIGDPADAVLFGQQCWSSGGKKLVITEGEIDAMSMSQVQNNRWPVVSVRDGAQSAPLSIKKSLEYVSSFDEVVFMFDNDEPGVDAAIKCAELLPPGKAKIAHLPLKDAGEMLEQMRVDELIDAMWRARPYRPDGIVAGEDLWDVLQEDDPVREADYPYTELDHMLHGLRRSEIVTFVAGTGVGKSTICKEVAHALIKQDKKVGFIALEETVKHTAKSLMSIELNQPLHLMPMDVEDPRFKEAYEATSAKVAFYDHFGSTESHGEREPTEQDPVHGRGSRV
jgi:twinkle protein